MELIFPKDGLRSIDVEGFTPANENVSLAAAEEVADLTLNYENDDGAKSRIIVQFKHSHSSEEKTSSYLKKTIQKFALAYDHWSNSPEKQKEYSLRFEFITNAHLAPHLQDAISALQSEEEVEVKDKVKRQKTELLKAWEESCKDKSLERKCKTFNTRSFFKSIEFQDGTPNLVNQKSKFHQTVNSWTSQSEKGNRLYGLTELVRDKAGSIDDLNYRITAEDVLEVFGQSKNELFPAPAQLEVPPNLESRNELSETITKLNDHNAVVVHAAGGVGKTVFAQQLKASPRHRFYVQIFDCFGNGAYRDRTAERHLPGQACVQIANELAVQGYSELMLAKGWSPPDAIKTLHARLKDAVASCRAAGLEGTMLIIDAVDNSITQASERDEESFAALLFDKLYYNPIEGLKLVFTLRTERRKEFKEAADIPQVQLHNFSLEQTTNIIERHFAGTNEAVPAASLIKLAHHRSAGNGRVLRHFLQDWPSFASDSSEDLVTVEHLIDQQITDAFNKGKIPNEELKLFFTGLARLPLPITAEELALAFRWDVSAVNSVVSDMMPLVRTTTRTILITDEPTDTYLIQNYGQSKDSLNLLLDSLETNQSRSGFAAKAFCNLIVDTDDLNRAYDLALKNPIPVDLAFKEFEQHELKTARLKAAFQIAVKVQDYNKALLCSMRLSLATLATEKEMSYLLTAPHLTGLFATPDSKRRALSQLSNSRMGPADTASALIHSFSGIDEEAAQSVEKANNWLNWAIKQRKNNYDWRTHFENSDVAAVIYSMLAHHGSNNLPILFDFNLPSAACEIAMHVIELTSLADQLQGKHLNQKIIDDAIKKPDNPDWHPSQMAMVEHLDVEALRQNKNYLQIALDNCAQAQNTNSYWVASNEEPTSYLVDATLKITSIVGPSQATAWLKSFVDHKLNSNGLYFYLDFNRNWPSLLIRILKAWTKKRKPVAMDFWPDDIVQPEEFDFCLALKDMEQTLAESERTANFYSSKSKKDDNKLGRQRASEFCKQVDLLLILSDAMWDDFSSSSASIKTVLSTLQTELRPNHPLSHKQDRIDLLAQGGFEIVMALVNAGHHPDHEDFKQFLDLQPVQIVCQEHFFRLFRALVKTNADEANIDLVHEKIKLIKNDDPYVGGSASRHLQIVGLWARIDKNEALALFHERLGGQNTVDAEDSDFQKNLYVFASKQNGGYLSEQAANRFMEFFKFAPRSDQAREYAWWLFAKAAGKSVGPNAAHRVLQWHDTDLVDFDYGLMPLLPKLCEAKHLTPSQAMTLITLCADHSYLGQPDSAFVKRVLQCAPIANRATLFNAFIDSELQKHPKGVSGESWVEIKQAADSIGVDDSSSSNFNSLKLQQALSGRTTSANHDYFTQRQDQDAAEIQAWLTANISNLAVSDLEGNLEQYARSPLSLALANAARELNAANAQKLVELLCLTTALDARWVLVQVKAILDARSDRASLSSPDFRNLLVQSFIESQGHSYWEYGNSSEANALLCDIGGDPKSVIASLFKHLIDCRADLVGSAWLEIATTLLNVTDSYTHLESLKAFLSDEATNLIEKHAGFKTKKVPGDPNGLFISILWHLLGDDDSVVRWTAANAIKYMLEFDMIDELNSILARFEDPTFNGVECEKRDFPIWNARQWFLLGLARAAHFHPDKIAPLADSLNTLAQSPNLHVGFKAPLLSILQNCPQKQAIEKSAVDLATYIGTPPKGFGVQSIALNATKAQQEFYVGHGFAKNAGFDLSNLFRIPRQNVEPLISEKIEAIWPEKNSRKDFQTRCRHIKQSRERYENAMEQAVRHSVLWLIEELAASNPVHLSPSSPSHWPSPWEEYVKKHSTTPGDGTWMSDHLDPVPAVGHLVLGNRDEYYQKVTLLEPNLIAERLLEPNSQLRGQVPIYGRWRASENVQIDVLSALCRTDSSATEQKRLQTCELPDFWLPTFYQNDSLLYSKPTVCIPLVWQPILNNQGLDSSHLNGEDVGLCRPRLTPTLTAQLGLATIDKGRTWTDNGTVCLSTSAWVSWDYYHGCPNFEDRHKNTVLFTATEWLGKTLQSLQMDLITIAEIKSSSSDKNSGSLGLIRLTKQDGSQTTNERSLDWKH